VYVCSYNVLSSNNAGTVWSLVGIIMCFRYYGSLLCAFLFVPII